MVTMSLHYGIGMLIALFLAADAHAGSAYHPFSAGSARLSISLGNGTAFDRNYTVFGIGGGYFITDGVELGLDAESWSGGSPGIQQISPQIRLVMNSSGPVKPYFGAFYRRTYISGYRDFDTAGGRLGAYVLTGSNVFLGAGLAQDVHLECDRTVFRSCSETYPEIFIAIMF